MVDLVRQTFTSEERARDGIVGPVGIGRLSGEVVAEDGLPMKEKAWYLLGFLEPMVPRLAELGFDEARLRRGVDAVRALPTLPEASLTQIAFRASARAPRA